MKSTREDLYHHLIKPISIGDQKAFSELYDLFYPSLIGFIFKKIPDEAVAEDLLHDLFLSLWKNRDKIFEIESLPAYLYSSCRYLIMAHFRKSVLIEYASDISDLDFPSEERPLEERLYFRYLLDIVHQEVENLPDKCRQIFKLSREQHLSNKEIGEKFGISESTVENHINKAIKKLRSVTRHFLHFFIFL